MIDQNDSMGGHMTSTTQSHRSYEMEVVTNLDNVVPNKPIRITYKLKNDKGEIVKNFDVVHEKIMHFITVRHDLQYFQHLHPEFNPQTGEFTISATFPTDGPYRLFPDFTPSDENPQKLPVTAARDVEIGDLKKYKAESVLQDIQTSKSFQGYDVKFSFPASLKAQGELTYGLNISKDGALVTNLQTYLGALGHSVILKEKTLDFIHTHALEGKGAGPEIAFATTFPKKGVYRIFTQFQHEGKVVTTNYAIQAE